MAIKDKAKQNAKFNFKDLTFCLNGRLNARRDALMQELATEQMKIEKGQSAGDSRLGSSKVTDLKKQIEALEVKMREASVVIRISAVNNGVWQKWIIQNPPRKNNSTDAMLGYNFESFFPMALQGSAQEVEFAGTEAEDWEDAVLRDIDSEDWSVLYEAWTAGDWDRVQEVLIVLNQREGKRGVDFLGRASATTTASEPTSDSPENSE